MPDGKTASDAFFLDFLSHADPSEREGLIKRLVKSAQATGQLEPVRAILTLKQRELAEARSELGGSPIKEEGEWLTSSQVYGLLHFREPAAVVEATLDSHRSIFGPRLADKMTVYWIDHKTLPILERKAESPFKYKDAMLRANEARASIEELHKTFPTLEQISDSPDLVQQVVRPPVPISPQSAQQTPDILAPSYVDPVLSKARGVWMSGPEVIAAGSNFKNYASISHIFKKHEGVFHTRVRHAKGHPLEGFVTQENAVQLSLSEFSETHLASLGFKLGEFTSAGQADSIPRPVPTTTAAPNSSTRVSGVWMSYASIISAGSRYKSGAGYFSTLVNKNQDLFVTRNVPNASKGIHKEVFVAEFNYQRLGLAEFPKAFIASSGLKLEEILDPREKKNSPSEDGERAPPKIKPVVHPSGVHGIWMTAKEIKAAGSNLYSHTYIATLFRKNEAEFQPHRDTAQGAPYRALVTMSNYQRLGLAEFPVIFAKQHNLLTLEDRTNLPAPAPKPPVVVQAIQPPASSEQLSQPPKKIKPVHRVPDDFGPESKFDVNGMEYALYPNRNYDESFVTKLLGRVHSGVFNNFGIQKFLDRTPKNEQGQIAGKAIIDLVSQVNGLIILGTSSTSRKLEAELGYSYTQIKEALVLGPGLEKYQHRVDGLIDTPYILASELPALKKDLDDFLRPGKSNTPPSTELVDRSTSVPKLDLKTAAKSIQQGIGFRKFEDTPPTEKLVTPAQRPSTNSPRKNYGPKQRPVREEPIFDPALLPYIQSWNRTFEETNIRPPRAAYHALLRLGILKLTNPAELIQTHSRFCEIMEGYEHVNLKETCNRMGYDWGEVTARTFQELKSRGLIKDLAKVARVETPGNFYVVQRGKMQEITGYIQNIMSTIKG